jgi:hypothetical protein
MNHFQGAEAWRDSMYDVRGRPNAAQRAPNTAIDAKKKMQIPMSGRSASAVRAAAWVTHET